MRIGNINNGLNLLALLYLYVHIVMRLHLLKKNNSLLKYYKTLVQENKHSSFSVLNWIPVLYGYIYIVCLENRSRRFHSYWGVTIAIEGLQNLDLLSAHGFWAGRDFYFVT